MKIELTVNGLKIQAQYQNEEIENVHKPLLRMLAALQTVNPQRRTVVFLCAPPGTGKSTQPPSGNISRNKTRNCPLFRRCRWMVFTITIAGWMRINCAPSKAHQRHLTLRNWRKICAGLWKGIVRGRSTIDKSMILLKMRCTLPHHSSSSKETGCCWMMKSGASLRNFVISRSLSKLPHLRCGSVWWGASWREGYRWQTQKPL